MAIFPRVQSPCPYKGNLSAIMDGDVCRMCKRQVVDISDWSDDERVALMQGCTDKVCVTYRFRPALAAATIAAAMVAAPTAAAACDASSEVIFVVGGINDPANTEWIEDESDSAIPALPVVYEQDEHGNAIPRGESGAEPQT